MLVIMKYCIAVSMCECLCFCFNDSVVNWMFLNLCEYSHAYVWSFVCKCVCRYIYIKKKNINVVTWLEWMFLQAWTSCRKHHTQGSQLTGVLTFSLASEQMISSCNWLWLDQSRLVKLCSVTHTNETSHTNTQIYNPRDIIIYKATFSSNMCTSNKNFYNKLQNWQHQYWHLKWYNLTFLVNN